MARILELSDQEFQTIVINKWRHWTHKVGSMQEQMGNAGRDRDILSRNQTEMPVIKNIVTEMKNALMDLFVD